MENLRAGESAGREGEVTGVFHFEGIVHTEFSRRSVAVSRIISGPLNDEIFPRPLHEVYNVFRGISHPVGGTERYRGRVNAEHSLMPIDSKFRTLRSGFTECLLRRCAHPHVMLGAC